MSYANALNGLKNVYFVGIGGVSMSSLALILKSFGKHVAGYDFRRSETTELVERNGIRVDYDLSEANANGFECIVYTAAVSDDNPILSKARAEGKKILSRAELLGMITSGYRHSVGVAGTHGKSTTTGFVSQIMLETNSDCTILAGAALPALDGSMYRVGNGDAAVFEACEYKNSYHHMFPTVKVVLNCELDHVDFFGTLDNVIASFAKYMSLPCANGKGVALVNADCENSVKAAEMSSAEVKYFSIRKKADFYARNIDMSDGYGKFDLYANGELICNVKLSVPGIHNVSNAVAAAGAAMLCGAGAQAVQKGLSGFTGVKRRFEKVGKLPCGAAVIDDYAHHPDEIRATLAAARKVTSGRVICIFQPHTYSRTKALIDDFANALEGCDKVILAPIYPAREEDVYGVHSEDLAAKIDGAEYFDSFEKIADRVKEFAEQGDMIITMGAGDIYKVRDLF